MPLLSAVTLAMLARKLNGRGEKRILFIGSRASLDDLYAMSRYSGRYQYIYLERFNFGEILKKYLPYPELRENNYHVDSRYVAGRRKTYDCIWQIVGYLEKILRFDAIMSTNLGYLEQQELAQVARDRSIPFVILLREGMVDPQNAPEYFSVYENKQAICDLFICYNEVIKRSILRQGVPGLTEENMKVSGIPRCDYYVRENNGRVENQLVVFTFNADVKFKKLLTTQKDLETARRLTGSFYDILLGLARRRPDIRIVFKTKPSDYYVEEMTRVAAEYFGNDGPPDNVVITGDGSAKDLVLQSRWVIAVSNSTTLLESLLANRVTGAPDFSKVIDPARWDFVQGDTELVTYIRGTDDLDRLIEKGDSDPEQRKTERYYEALNQYLYRTDGQASVRAEGYMADLFAAGGVGERGTYKESKL